MTHGYAEIFGPICASGCTELRLPLLWYLEFVSEKLAFPLFYVVCLFVCISWFSCVGIDFILRQCPLPSPLPKDSRHKAGKSGHSLPRSLPVAALEASAVRLMCQALSKHQRCMHATALAAKDGEINRRMSPAGCGKPFLVL